MRPIFTTLLVLFILTFSASDLFADKYPKSNGRSFKPCPVNAKAGRRAAVRKTQIRHRKVKHTGVHTYVVSSTPTRSTAPAASGGGASDNEPTSTDASGGTTAPAPATPTTTTTSAPVPINDEATDVNKVSVDQAQISVPDTTTARVVPVDMPTRTDNSNTDNVQAVPINRSTTVVPRTTTSTQGRAQAATTSKPASTSTNGTTNTSNTVHPTNINRVNVNQQSGSRAVQPTTSVPNTTVNTVVPTNVNYINLSNIEVIHN